MMKTFNCIMVLLFLPMICLAQWGVGFNPKEDYTIKGDWDFDGGVIMKAVILDSITINYIDLQGPIAFDSLGSAELSSDAYLDFSLSDNGSGTIYWFYMDANNNMDTDGILRANGMVIGHYDRIYKGALSDPRIEFKYENDYIGLDAGHNQNAGSIRIGDTDAAGEYTSVDTLGIASFPVGGIIITPGAVPASPAEGQFCITSTGDSMGVYINSGWRWLIAGE